MTEQNMPEKLLNEETRLPFSTSVLEENGGERFLRKALWYGSMIALGVTVGAVFAITYAHQPETILALRLAQASPGALVGGIIGGIIAYKRGGCESEN